jgi:hypothetical protein
MSAARVWRGLVLLSCLALCGCILITDHDLHIVRIDDVVVLNGPKSPARPWASEAGLLVIRFTADLDVIAHAADYEKSYWIEASFCRRGSFDEDQLLDDMVYYRDIDDGIHDWAQNPPGADPLHYRYLIQLARHHVSQDATPSYHYDMRANPQDVSFRIRGSRYFSRGYRSNIMMVPAAAIAAAINKAGG